MQTATPTPLRPMRTSRPRRAHQVPATAPETGYVPLPLRLMAALADSPLALGLYALIGRLYLVAKAPVPLSGNDVALFEGAEVDSPAWSRAQRALQRLVREGWLEETKTPGGKSQYVPIWGYVRATPRAWQAGVPRLGRPPHVQICRLDLRLLDHGMGRLEPHKQRHAHITRYLERPLLTLYDVGTYMLALIPDRGGTTPALERYHLVRGTRAQPVPPLPVLVSLASQSTLEQPAIPLSEKGARQLAPGLGDREGDQGGDRQGDQVADPRASAIMAPEADEPPLAAAPVSIHGSTWIDKESIPPYPPTGGVEVVESRSCPDQAANREIVAPKHIPPDLHRVPRVAVAAPEIVKKTLDTPSEQELTPTVRELRTLNVRPDVVEELADRPIEEVRAAIADGRARPYVNDLAGWVVSMLRDARDHGWDIDRARRTVAGAGLTVEEMQARIERAKASGLFTYDGDDQTSVPPTPPPAPLPPDVEPVRLVPVGPPPPLPEGEVLEAQLKNELRGRVSPATWPAVTALQITRERDLVQVRCPPAQLVAANELLVLLRSIIRRLDPEARVQLLPGGGR